MNAHVAELLAAIGPGLCYGLFGLALFGMRACFKSFENVLKKNVQAHDEMLERLNQHEIRLGNHDLRLDSFATEHMAGNSRADHLDSALQKLSERITRLEAREALLTSKTCENGQGCNREMTSVFER